MAYLFGDGFDFYATASDAATRWDQAGTNNVALQNAAATAFGTGNCVQWPINGNDTWSKDWGSNETTIYFSIRVNIINSGGADRDFVCFKLRDGANDQVSINFGSDGNLFVYHGNETGTLLGSAAAAMPGGTWNSFQGKVVIDASAGSVEIRKNGAATAILSLVDVNTQGGTGNSYANTLVMNDSGTGNYSSKILFDDLLLVSASGAAPNGWLGDVRAIQQMPAGITQTELAVTGASSNATAVANLTEDGDNSYVSSSTVGQEDIYTLGAIPPNNTIVGINLVAYWRKTDSGARAGTLSIAANGSTDTAELTQAALSPSYTYSTMFLPVDPTGASWTPATLSAASLGLKVSG